MSDISFLSIFFKFVNFFILIGIITYIYKHYMAASLKASINEGVQKITTITRALFDNERKIEQLKNNITIQKATIEDIESKLQKWQQISKEESDLAFQQQEKLVETINKKRAIQSFYLSHHIVEKEIMRAALRAAKEDLMNTCSQSDKVRYFDKLNSFMHAELQK